MAAKSVIVNSQAMPRPSGRRQPFTQQVNRTLSVQRAHRLTVAPVQVFLQLVVQIFYTGKLFPVIEIPLVISVASFRLAIVPRCPGRNQDMLYSGFLQGNIKRALFRFTDILVGELRAVICLDSLNRKVNK